MSIETEGNIMPRHLALLPPSETLTIAKRYLVYNLLLLENARNVLDRELRNFTEQANVEVLGFLDTQQPTNLRDCNKLLKALHGKCHVIQKISEAFKNLITNPQFIIRAPSKQSLLSSQQELPRGRSILVSDMLKFGPMLQNVLMAGSITSAVQVLGATLSLHQLQLHFTSQTNNGRTRKAMTYSMVSSSHHTPVLEAPSLPCQGLNKHNEARKVICSEQTKQVQQSILVKPVLTPQINISKSPPITPLPSKSKLSACNPINTPRTSLLIDQGLNNNFYVQHQKLTSSQLVDFLRSNAKNKHVMEITFYEKSDHFQYTSGLSKTDAAAIAPPLEGGRNHHTAGMEGQRSVAAEIPLRRQLFQRVDTQAPVFTVKRMESGGSLTYRCMIATKTELWDVGDILTDVEHVTSEEETVHQIPIDGYHVESTNNTIFTPNLLHTNEANLKLEVSQDPQSSLNCSHLPPVSLFRVPEHKQLDIPKSVHSSLLEFQVRKFEEMAVVVSHMVSPGCFCIQHADSLLKLQTFITDSLRDSRSFAELQIIPDIGVFVMGWFPRKGNWCRAQVTKICGLPGDTNPADRNSIVSSIQVEVKRLDYGDTSCLSLWDIKEFHTGMTSLPIQAVQVSLANVVPVDGHSWSQEAVGWFKDMVENRTLFARLYSVGDGDRAKVLVELFMERGKIGAMRRGASLSLRLAQNGHAKHEKLRNVGIKRSSAQEQTKKRESAWEKYLISCYTQHRK